jgi:hypothetical protein
MKSVDLFKKKKRFKTIDKKIITYILAYKTHYITKPLYTEPNEEGALYYQVLYGLKVQIS